MFLFFIHELFHLFVGLSLYLSMSKIIPRSKHIFWAFAVSLLLDVDHLLDYFIALGLRFDLNAIFHGSYFADNNKIIIPLHSWELGILLIAFGWIKKFKKYRWWVVASGMGILAHLIADQVWYQAHPLTYSLFARIFHHFTPSYFW